MREKLHFAIVGCGRIGWRHAEIINGVGKLIAVCDIVSAKAKELGAKYAATVYDSVEAMLNGDDAIDVVSVCTPNALHAPHSIACLRNGMHVLCEKPMALTVNDCEQMIAAAVAANRHLFIVKQNRYNPPVLAVKKLLDENRLGKIYSVQLNCFWNRDKAYYQNSWKGTKELDGGTLFTQFSHFIDLLYWMLGDVKNVHAFTGNYKHTGVIEFEDTGTAILQFCNGAIGSINYTVNSFDHNMEGSLTIFGEKGTVKIGGQYLNELEYQCIENYVISDLPAGNPANNYGSYSGSMSNHGEVYSNVLEVLQSDGTVATNGFEGLKTVEIINRIYESAIGIGDK